MGQEPLSLKLILPKKEPLINLGWFSLWRKLNNFIAVKNLILELKKRNALSLV